jgi:hypothetical protein
MPVLMVDWTRDEDRVVRSYARAFLEGKYPRITKAGAACFDEFRRLRKVAPARYRVSRRRTLKDICARIDRFVVATGLPHPAGLFTKSEMRVVDRYALAVAKGRYKAPLPATRPCYRALRRLWQRAARRVKPPLRHFVARTFDAVHARLIIRAHDFGYRGAPRRRWLPVERRIAAKWRGRYVTFRVSDTPWSINDTARSLEADLASSGYRRTVSACHAELKLELMGRIAASKFEG